MRLRCCESALWIPVFLGVTRHGKYSAVYELLADKYNADIQKGWLGGIYLTPLLRSPAGSVKKLLKTTRRLDASTLGGGRGSGDGSSGRTQEFFTSGHRIGPPPSGGCGTAKKLLQSTRRTRRLDAD